MTAPSHKRHSRSPARGANTPTPAAKAARAHARATPAIAGASASTKRDNGTMTSAPSAIASTNYGRPPEPQPATTPAATLPYTLALSASHALKEMGAEEVIRLTGAGVLVLADRPQVDLNFGDWLLVRYFREPDSEFDQTRLYTITL